MKANDQTDKKRESTDAQLSALIVLLADLLVQVSKDRTAAQAREKAAAVLVAGGMSKQKAAKLLSLQKTRVVRASERMKI